MYPSPLKDGGYDIADFLAHPPRLRRSLEDFTRFVDQAHQLGHARDRRLRHEPHLERSPVVPGVALEPGLARSATGTCGRTPMQRYRGRAHHLHRHRGLELDVGPGRRRRTTGTASSTTSPTSTTTIPRCGKRCWTPCASGSTSGSTGSASTPCRTSTSATGTNCENLPETHAFLRRVRAHIDESHPDTRAAGRGEPVARRRRRVLRRRRRVPHGVPLPRHAAHVHGAAARGGAADLSRSSPRRRPSPTTASGACSCATTTS